MVADNPSLRTGPCLEVRHGVSCRHRILACALFLTSCGGCQETSPVTPVQEQAPLSLEIAPKGVSLVVGESLRFSATIVGGLGGSRTVRWLASGGPIDQTGLFHAGNEAGTYEVRAELETGLEVLRDVSSGPIVPLTEVDDVEPEPGVLFQDGFEDNHFQQWSGLAPAGDPHWNGMGDGGAHIGDGYITDEQAHSGRLSWKALVDPTRSSYGPADKSSLERWKSMKGISDFYISAWYFIPTDYPAVWSNIMQIKAAGSGPSRKPVALAITKSRELIVYSGILDTTVLRSGVFLPMGQWFNLSGRFVIANSGLVEVFLDGHKVAAVRTDTKDNDYAYPGVGNYIDADYYTMCYIYIDDVKVTTSPP